MARFIHNHGRGRGATLPEDLTQPHEFHRKLPRYEVSPLRALPSIAKRAGVGAVWVKDESHRLGLPSFKILGASWGTYRALDKYVGGFPPWERFEELVDALAPYRPLVLVAATDGNHGRAVAYFAKLLKLEARIFVPEGMTTARIQSIESEGATCETVEGTYDDAVERAAQEAGGNRLVISDTSWPGYEDVPRWVIDGYSTIFSEIDEQLLALGEQGPEVVVVQVGVGALAAAAGKHFRKSQVDPQPLMISVEPEQAAGIFNSIKQGTIVTVPGPHTSIMAGLNCGTPSIVAWPTVSTAYDVYMTIEDDRAREGMKLLAEEGLASGETGAAGLGGLLEFLGGDGGAERRARYHIDRDTRVLLLSTEGVTDPDVYEQTLSGMF